MKRISDDEIQDKWLKGWEEQKLESIDLEDIKNNLYYEDMFALKAVAQAQLDSCEKEHKEKVREIFEGIERVDPVLLVHSFAPTVVRGKLKTKHLSENECMACRWQALKQKCLEHK